MNVEDLCAVVSLKTIGFVELSAKRSNSRSEPHPGDDAVGAPTFTLNITRADHEFQVQLRLDLDFKEGSARIEPYAIFKINDATQEIPDDDERLLLEFANKVGVPLLIPSLREALADITRRVIGIPLIMPLYPGGILFQTSDENS